MGACASMVGELAGVEVPQMPTIDIDLSSLKESVNEFSGGIPNTIAENAELYRAECANLQNGEEYAVPNSTIKLSANASDAEFTKAAIMTSCGEQVRDMLKEQVWTLADPLIDVCLDLAMSQAPVPIPDMLIQKAKDVFRGNVVDPLTDKAIDKAMSIALKKCGCSAEEIEGCAASTASAKKDQTLTMEPMEVMSVNHEASPDCTMNGKTESIEVLAVKPIPSGGSPKDKSCCRRHCKKIWACICACICILLVVGTVAYMYSSDECDDCDYMYSSGGSWCSSHDECDYNEFCAWWGCASCDDCRYCDQGTDGTCGDCGDYYPLDEDSTCEPATSSPAEWATPSPTDSRRTTTTEGTWTCGCLQNVWEMCRSGYTCIVYPFSNECSCEADKRCYQYQNGNRYECANGPSYCAASQSCGYYGDGSCYCSGL